MKTIPMMETRTVALLTALAIGFGLAFHSFFFVVAAGIMLFVVAGWTSRETRRFLIEFRRKIYPAHSR
jgi:hypothetical protein